MEIEVELPHDRNVLFATCLYPLLARIDYYNKELVRRERPECWQLKVVQIEETKIERWYVKYIDCIRRKSFYRITSQLIMFPVGFGNELRSR